MTTETSLWYPVAELIPQKRSTVVSDYAGKKHFTIHQNDAGSEAYDDRYVEWLEQNIKYRDDIIGLSPDGDRHAHLVHEIERLQAWVADLQSGMHVNCVYCGHRYGPKKDTPVAMADVLKAHIEQCPQHPMSKLKAERDDLARALFQVRSLTMRGRGDSRIADLACDAVRSIDEAPLFEAVGAERGRSQDTPFRRPNYDDFSQAKKEAKGQGG